MAEGEGVGFNGDRFLSDAPICKASEDCYGRAANAAVLADVLRRVKSDESFVVGLSGEWGSGKSSFVNLVCDNLRKPKNGEVATRVVTFNPWLIEDRKALLSSFFAALASAFPEKTQRWRGQRDSLSGLLLQYSSVLTEGSLTAAIELVPRLVALGGIPVAIAGPILLGLSKHLLNRLAAKLHVANPNLDDLREQICVELRKLDANIVLVIDDVDRLSSDEVRLIFKLVTLSASFPRITYLLSFDKDVVATALAGVQEIDGRRYLEKVVQLDVEMPPLGPDFVLARLNERLVPLLDRDKFYKDDRDGERLRVIYQGLIMPSLTTPRKVTRYINRALSKYWSISDEVCLVDILGLAAIELCSPEIFEVLWTERNIICRGGQSALLPDERKRRSQALKMKVEAGLPNNLYRGHALGALFPGSPLSATAVDSSITAEAARAEGRICCLDLFAYYRGGFYLPALYWDEVINLVTSADERSLTDAFEMAVKEGRLIEYCHIIGGHFDGLTAAQALHMVRPVLLCLGKSDEFYQILLTRSSADEELTRFLKRLGAIAGVDAFSRAITGSLSKLDVDNFIGSTWLIRDELLVRDDGTPDANSAQATRKVASLTGEALSELLGKYCDALAAHGDDVVRRADFWPLSIWEKAAERIGSDSYKRFVDSVSAEPRRNVLYYAGRLGESFSSGHYAHCYGQGFAADELEVGIIKDALYNPDWLNDLRESARERVATLYLLCVGSEDVHPDYGVPDWAARNQLERWGIRVK